jgi:hypothetical protein
MGGFPQFRRIVVRWALILAVTIGTLAGVYYWMRYPSYVEGPPSPEGLRVKVEISDAFHSWSADFYADVKILDSEGRILAKRKDSYGQGSWEGVEKMMASMKWRDGKSLEFAARPEEEPIVLDVPRAPSR